MSTTWDAVERQLTSLLTGLREGQLLTVEVPGTRREVVLRPRQLLGLVRERRGVGWPAVQVRGGPQHMLAELIGSPEIGGVYPWTAEERDRIAALGWLPLLNPAIFSSDYQYAWDRTMEPQPAAAAALIVRTLVEVGGCTTPDDLVVSGPHLKPRPRWRAVEATAGADH
jgi:hypothetical protein